MAKEIPIAFIFHCIIDYFKLFTSEYRGILSFLKIKPIEAIVDAGWIREIINNYNQTFYVVLNLCLGNSNNHIIVIVYSYIIFKLLNIKDISDYL